MTPQDRSAYAALGRFLGLVQMFDWGADRGWIIGRMKEVRQEYLKEIAASSAPQNALSHLTAGAERTEASTGKTGASNSEEKQ